WRRRAGRVRVEALGAAWPSRAIFVIGFPFPLGVLAAAATGLALGPRRLGVTVSDEGTDRTASLALRRRRTLPVLAVGLAVWWIPLLVVVALTGVGSIYSEEGLFFSQVAVISFGGAYAVLAYVAHEVVRRFGLSPDDVVAGLALAETTPGPLILVVEFYGFLAAYRNPGTLAPAVAGAIGAVVTVCAAIRRCRVNVAWVALGGGLVGLVLGVVR